MPAASSRSLVLVLFCSFFLGAACWAQESLSRVSAEVASVYRAPSTGAERVTQVLLGDPVKVKKISGNWVEVVVPDQYRSPEGYPGWMQASDLVRSGASPSRLVTVAYPEVHLRERPSAEAEVVCDAGMASRLALSDNLQPADSEGDQWLPVQVPGLKRAAWVRARQVMEEKALRRGQGEVLVDRARLFKGTPYLWGGMTREGIDCSGLTYTVYRLHGVTLPRDADQQFLVGTKVSRQDLEPGDLVFFGADSNDITHVGMYAGNGNFVQASSGRGVVESKLFQGWYLNHYQGARRVLRDSPPEKMVLVPDSSEGSR